MFFIDRKISGIVPALFTILLLCQHVAAAPADTTITVVMDNNYPPYIFLDSSGTAQGILIDQWHLWEQKTGYHANISALDWNDALLRMDAGEYDVIDTIFISDARELKYDFSKPYATIDVPLFFHKDLSGISGVDSVRGFVVAVKSGDYSVDYLKSRGVTELREYPSYEAIVAAAKTGDVVVFCIDRPPALYFLYKNGIQDQFHQTAPLYSGQFHRAVKKGDLPTLEIVEEGFNRITPAEYQDIEQKWYGAPVISNENLGYILAAGVVILAGFLLLLLWNRTLKETIDKKTAELRMEVAIGAAQAEAFKESEERYRLLFEHNPAPTLIYDRGTLHLLAINEAFEQYFGYTSDDVLSMRLTDLHPEEEKGPVTELVAGLTGRARTGEWHYRGKDGSLLTVVMYSHDLVFKGINARVAVITDITDLKRAEDALRESEALFREVINNADEAIFLNMYSDDKPGTFILVNDSATRWLGYTHEELLHMSLMNVIPGHSFEKFSPYVTQELLKDGYAAFEAALVRKDGTEFPVGVNTRIFLFRGKRMVLSIVRDITDSKKAEETLQIARKKLALLNEVTFQDLESALFSLSSYLEFMKRDTSDKTLMNYLEKGKNILTKTASVLNFTKDYQNMGINPPRWQNVSQVFLFAISHLPPLTMERIIAVDDLEIYADPLLETAFFNLVGSMQKHGKGATRLILHYEQPGDYIILILEQNGDGVPAEEKGHFFKRGSESGDDNGYGIFLAKEILSITDISINETGQAGEGIRFEMQIPKGAYRFMAGKKK